MKLRKFWSVRGGGHPLGSATDKDTLNICILMYRMLEYACKNVAFLPRGVPVTTNSVIVNTRLQRGDSFHRHSGE